MGVLNLLEKRQTAGVRVSREGRLRSRVARPAVPLPSPDIEDLGQAFSTAQSPRPLPGPDSGMLRLMTGGLPTPDSHQGFPPLPEAGVASGSRRTSRS